MRHVKTILYVIAALVFALFATATLTFEASLLQTPASNPGLVYFNLLATLAFILLAVHYVIHAVQTLKGHREPMTANLRLGLLGYFLLALAAIVSFFGGAVFKAWPYSNTQLWSDAVYFLLAALLAGLNFSALGENAAVFTSRYHRASRPVRRAARAAPARKPSRKAKGRKKRR